MRVLQLCAVDFTVQHFLLPWIHFLEDRGFEVTTACSPGPHFEALKASGVRMHPIRIKRSYDVAAHWRAVNDLTAYLRRERFDILHAHTPIAGLIGRMAAARAGTPIRLYTAHGFYFHDRMAPWLRRAHIALERFGGKKTDFLFTQSAEDRETAIRQNIMPPGRVLAIGNGVDLQTRFARARVDPEERERVRSELGLSAGDRVVAMIGRLVPEKGYRELFAAAESIVRREPRFRLLVIGDALASDRGGGRGAFARELAPLGECVVFAGHRSDIPVLLSLAEVFTLPSHREGMPRSIIEAMGMELPVVATDIRGCREEVVEGETGHLVPVGDAKALADRIAGLLADPDRARLMGQAGRRRAEEMFDEQKVLERQLAVIEGLIAEKGLGGGRQ